MSKPAREHPFNEFSEKIGGSWVKTAKVVCCYCLKVGTVKVTRGSTLLAPPGVIKKFHEMGWEIGRNCLQNVCPDCQAKKPKTAHLTVVSDRTEENKMAVVEPIVKTDPPRTMTREDRRIIFEKMNGVYLDEKRGYDSGWSDVKLATDLGVPRAWVEQVREEMFGPVSSNPEIEAFVRAVADLDEFKKQLTTAATLQTQLNNIQTVLKGVNTSEILHRMTRLEKLAGDLRKHCVNGK